MLRVFSESKLPIVAMHSLLNSVYSYPIHCLPQKFEKFWTSDFIFNMSFPGAVMEQEEISVLKTDSKLSRLQRGSKHGNLIIWCLWGYYDSG